MAALPTSNLSDTIMQEFQFVKVPFEHYKNTIRPNNRSVKKGISSVISAVDSVSLNDDTVSHLSSLVSRLHGLKRKEGSQVENLQAQRIKARLDHLESTDANSILNNTRLTRIIVDYMLHMTYYESAAKLIEASKIQSIFEFQLRLQEFIDLVREDNKMCAIEYAWKYLTAHRATHMKELQSVIAKLVFGSSTECDSYKVLFEPKQWDHLVDLFNQEFYRLYGMTLELLLKIYLQAGLIALKTPFCYKGECPKADPLFQESLRELASSLPFPYQPNSKLVCYITKELMDAENPPMALPNGLVYSNKALEEMASWNNGRVTCPRTGLVCNYSDLTKVYVS
ncbi:protein MAEA homolog isoform X2 [Amaranthus tricolor]|uniref:protein MAEA homolog isoform X2 n=1 Tax=Amaranthus tricolor TaxID=29722 RepID=UPI002588E0F1|nr:protein MAEA homolog isoform X2 [Amaranthus tricolor]